MNRLGRAAAALVAASALLAVPVITAGTSQAMQPAAAKPAAGAAAVAPELKKGSKGEAVKVLQGALVIPVTGYFGPVTQIAVVKFQKAKGLAPTGVVSVETWTALGDSVARKAAEVDASFGDKSVDGRFCPAEKFYYGDGMGADRGDHSHQGLDMMGTMGTPIYAVDDGRVTNSGYQSNGALVMDVTSKDGHMWFYGHFSKVFFKEGAQVKAGQLIGLMGDTGAPGAVHLHIELHPGGWNTNAVDPEPLLRTLCA